MAALNSMKNKSSLSSGLLEVIEGDLIEERKRLDGLGVRLGRQTDFARDGKLLTRKGHDW